MEQLVPKDHGEAVALFRSQLIGPLVHRQLTRGELHTELVALSKLRVTPPTTRDWTRSPVAVAVAVAWAEGTGRFPHPGDQPPPHRRRWLPP